VLAAAWFAYARGIPWAARQLADRIPVQVEAELGEESLKALERFALKPSRVDASRRANLQTGFAEMRRATGLPASTRLEFRKGGLFGPNALALPGGIVVVTDEMVALLADYEVTAVLAHELGHQSKRHGTRLVLASSLHALLAMAVLGDVSSVAGLAATFPTVLLTRGYSRDFEREADAFAIELMRRVGRRPSDYARALEALKGELEDKWKIPGRGGPGAPDFGYFATHPSLDERIAEASNAASRVGR
jgi:Zn-dependent protease with chaperone function